MLRSMRIHRPARIRQSLRSYQSLADGITAASDWNVDHISNQSAAAPKDPYFLGRNMPGVAFSNCDKARTRIEKWEGYKRTPLVHAPDIARACGLGSVYVKDEGSRFGLGSFKGLGGGLVVHDLAENRSPGEQILKPLTVATASAGNHGIGVAWGAGVVGCKCVVYLPKAAPEAQAEKMRSHGATVRRVSGNYEDALRQCQMDSAAEGWHVVQDVASDDYHDIPRRIWEGYSVVAAEILDDLAEQGAPLPTHIFVNSGVGGFASAMSGYLWDRLRDRRPRFITVEPIQSDCLLQSGKAGTASPARSADEASIQGGLDCKAPCPLAWRILEAAANDFVAVPDESVPPAMRVFADHTPSLVAGESAVAGMAALLAAAAQPQLKQALGLSEKSHVMLIACENAQDADTFKKYVGRSVEEVEVNARH